jgi:antitoxin CptB
VSDIDRVRWHCRRGMLELDLVLSRFLDRHFAGLTAGQQAAFKRLLEYPDNELWDLVSKRSDPTVLDPETRTVARLLQDG